MLTVIPIFKLFVLVFTFGAALEALVFHLAMYKPRDNRYAKYMLGSFVMFCLGLGSWFMLNLVEATYLEMVARGIRQ